MEDLEKPDAKESYVRNSILILRDGDSHMFHVLDDGTVLARLDGYAVLPVKKYHELSKSSNPTAEGIVVEGLLS